MEVVKGASVLAATKELRVELLSARLMVVVDDVNFWGVQKVLKGVQISVLLMVVAGVAVKKDALGLPEGNLDCAFGMVVARDARLRAVQRVQKAFLVSALHMEVVAVVSILNAIRGLKGARCTARLMVVANAAHI